MNIQTSCPQCSLENIYFDGSMWNCPDCGFEWIAEQSNESLQKDNVSKDEDLVRDSNGQILQAGDHVVVVKELKFKGSAGQIKAGTKVRNIRLQDDGDGHDIAGKIEGLGFVNLKSQFVRKS